jgi:C_GCAxxG_C_C family probable redox protein
MKNIAEMSDIRRRDLFGYLGVAMGTGIAASCRPLAEASPAKLGPSGSPTGSAPWTYARLDPTRVSETVYEIYGEGGCMYAIVGGILACAREEAEVSVPAFPLHMMKYGAGGVGGWGTLCGALNGAAAIIGLFVVDKHSREQLINDLFAWYERMKLPRYRPSTGNDRADIVATTSRSVLCHVSVGTWCHQSGCKVDSKEKTERCRRLTVDVAMKTVDLLNAYCLLGQAYSESGSGSHAVSEPQKTTIPGEAMGKMRCDSCHQPGESRVNVESLRGREQ